MTQNVFGAGVLWATPTTDAYGNTIANPTPVQFGIAQEVSVDVSFDTKMLYGQNQFPVAVGRGKDDTLFALEAGRVEFGAKRGRKTVNITPVEVAVA